jgi:hypothetical protein
MSSRLRFACKTIIIFNAVATSIFILMYIDWLHIYFDMDSVFAILLSAFTYTIVSYLFKNIVTKPTLVRTKKALELSSLSVGVILLITYALLPFGFTPVAYDVVFFLPLMVISFFLFLLAISISVLYAFIKD